MHRIECDHMHRIECDYMHRIECDHMHRIECDHMHPHWVRPYAPHWVRPYAPHWVRPYAPALSATICTALSAKICTILKSLIVRFLSAYCHISLNVLFLSHFRDVINSSYLVLSMHPFTVSNSHVLTFKGNFLLIELVLSSYHTVRKRGGYCPSLTLYIILYFL